MRAATLCRRRQTQPPEGTSDLSTSSRPDGIGMSMSMAVGTMVGTDWRLGRTALVYRLQAAVPSRLSLPNQQTS